MDHLEPADGALVAEIASLLATDPASLSGPELAESMLSLDRIRRRMDGVELAYEREFDRSMEWAIKGYASPGSWLVNHTERSRSTAGGMVQTARRLEEMPATAKAVASGELGWAKAAMLGRTRTAEVRKHFDLQEPDLVETVKGLTVDGTRRYLEAWRLRALADGGDEKAIASHDLDRLHLSQTLGGRYRLDADLCPEDGAILSGAISGEIDGWFHRGELEGDERTPGQLRSEALMTLVRRAVGGVQHGDARPLVIATVHAPTTAQVVARDPHDLAALEAEILGAGPVPFSTIERLLCEGDICRVVARGPSRPLDVGRRERLATADQWRALIAVSGGTCEVHGCTVPHHQCQVHHLNPWNAGGRTDIANLALVCTGGHHRDLHEGGWTFERTAGGIVFRTRDGTVVEPPLRERPP